MEEKCIIWEGSKWSKGRYGLDFIDGKATGAHRAAWIRKNGEIPKGLVVCHKCDNGLCVNTDHLFLGTLSDNMQDCLRKGRFNRPSQKGSNNNNARKDYIEIRIKSAEMKREGYTLSQIREVLKIKSNGHLIKIIADGNKMLKDN